MSDNRIDTNRAAAAETELAAAELQREAEHIGRRQAEVQRDVVMDVAAEQAIERDNASRAAEINAEAAIAEAQRRHMAENMAVNNRIAANQANAAADQLATERNVLRENLAVERAQASSANFGMVLVTCLLLAALIGGGIWYFNSQNVNPNAQTASAANSGTSQTASVRPAPTPAPAAAPLQPINATAPAPAPVIVNTPPPPAPKVIIHEAPPAAAPTGSGGSIAPTQSSGSTGGDSSSATGTSDSSGGSDTGK